MKKYLTSSKKDYIITESQLKLLCENKSAIFQFLINRIFEGINTDCADDESESFPDDLSLQSCDEAEWIDRIKINNYNLSNLDSTLTLNVDIYSHSVGYFEPNTLLYDISKKMSDVVGTKVKINIDQFNTKKSNF